MYKTMAKKIQYDLEHEITNEGRRRQPAPVRERSECCERLNASAAYNEIARWVRYLSNKPDVETDPMITGSDILKLERWGLLDAAGRFDAEKAKRVLENLRPEDLGKPIPYKEKTYRKELPLA